MRLLVLAVPDFNYLKMIYMLLLLLSSQGIIVTWLLLLLQFTAPWMQTSSGPGSCPSRSPQSWGWPRSPRLGWWGPSDQVRTSRAPEPPRAGWGRYWPRRSRNPASCPSHSAPEGDMWHVGDMSVFAYIRFVPNALGIFMIRCVATSVLRSKPRVEITGANVLKKGLYWDKHARSLSP